MDEFLKRRMKNEPAFPTQMWDEENKEATWLDGGLTKREYFAAMAMQGIIVCCPESGEEEVARMSVEQADALIEQLEKEGE